MDEQTKRIREALLAERRAQITAQRAQRRDAISERQMEQSAQRHEEFMARQSELSAKKAQRREEVTQEKLRQAALLQEERLRRQLARAAIRAARKERLIIIFKKSDNQQK